MPSTKNAPTAADVDLERFGLRAFLEALGPDELEVEANRVELGQIAERVDNNPRAVWFQAPGDSKFSLCANVAASRSRLAAAFGTTPSEVLQEILSRLDRPGQLVEVPRETAPVQQVVLTGEDCDLTALPIHLQHDLDGAPYISASMDFVHDPMAGHTNVGMRRLMLRGRRTAGWTSWRLPTCARSTCTRPRRASPRRLPLPSAATPSTSWRPCCASRVMSSR